VSSLISLVRSNGDSNSDLTFAIRRDLLTGYHLRLSGSFRLSFPLQALRASSEPGECAFTPTSGGQDFSFSRILTFHLHGYEISLFSAGKPGFPPIEKRNEVVICKGLKCELNPSGLPYRSQFSSDCSVLTERIALNSCIGIAITISVAIRAIPFAHIQR